MDDGDDTIETDTDYTTEAVDVRSTIRKWRNQFTVQHAKDRCNNVRESYSMATFSSGGLLDTISAI